MKTSADHHLEILALVILLAFGAFWYFGRTYALERRSTNEWVMCERCGGSGMMKCPACNGFGSVEEMADCPACEGSGKHQWKITRGPEAPCPKCLGTGKVSARKTCEECGGSGKQVCTACCGEGMVESPTLKTEGVFMCPSLWERGLACLGLSVPSNPCPQRLYDGSYPLVQRFLSIRSGGRDVRVATWGRFRAEADQWKMRAEIEVEKPGAATIRKWVEFSVKDRLLVQGRVVEAPQP